MTIRKIGARILAAGVVILLVALLLLFNTSSAWALVALGLSVAVNTAGVAMLMMRGKDADD